MTVKIGFIGAGRMASAMIKGLIAKEVYAADEIVACAPSAATRDRIAADTGVQVFASAA
jgi:pyrroline-5-carboxylate reductase